MALKGKVMTETYCLKISECLKDNIVNTSTR